MATRHIRLGAVGNVPGTGSIAFIGGATTLIEYAGFTVLTDPSFLPRGHHARLGDGLRSRRLTDPACAIESLPPLDLVVLSHLHADHWDDITEAKLDRRVPVVTTPRAAETLEGRGFVTEALARWDAVAFSKGDVTVRITAMPARHGPALLSRLLPDVMGSMLEFEAPGGRQLLRLYVTGDTVVHDSLREIRVRYPDIDLALLHLGGARVLGAPVTMDARQGVQLMRIVQPRGVIPVHHDDYSAFSSSLADFRKEAEQAGLADRIHELARGERYVFEVPIWSARPA